ncbi:MAG: single-stranded-DNA-specific exonuclease RecJ [Ignavibacteriae bacterium]|nr:single-stranded-DNA-specific exonuclease RecJ [Ignavibacteriota bacterium]MCB9242392.1 single-stranded-DNA-specific exonuclease RecJ [Ignavibacteriales bacterium]
MEKIWKLKELVGSNGSDHEESIDNFITEMRALRTNIQVPEMILRLLFSRGITNYAKTVKFFKPTKERLYDPFLLKDGQKASERISDIIASKEKIMVLGDYDVDGTCGVSMFYLFLKHFGVDSIIYIPDRIEEGYGISEKAINLAHEQGIKLIVSIDCGITAYDKVEYAKTLGIDFIICDHHRPPDRIPDAFAVLDPIREDDTYPFKYLCGTGVAFKLIQGACKLMKEEEFAYTLLDFVAIATASDIVPLIDENRIILHEGLEMINNNPRPSIRTILEASGVTPGTLNTAKIVFTLAPRINAVGRLGDAKRAVEMLTSIDDEELVKLADELNEENLNRREIDKTITEHAIRECEELVVESSNYTLVVHNEDWHPGVIGIVAARLVEKFHLPSVVLTTVNGVAKGSARSITGFNIYEALKKCEHELIQFGGHYHAAGLEIEIDKIDGFKTMLNKIASEELSQDQLLPEMLIDAELSFEDISNQFVKILTFFEPYGPENMTPIFTTKKVQIVGDVRYAKSHTHIFRVKEEESELVFDAVFFSSEKFHDDIQPGRYCDICYSIDNNYWNGAYKTKLRIRDIKFPY